MLSLEWAELDIITVQIRRLQAERIAARASQNLELARSFGAELERALCQRDGLMSRITASIGADVASDAPLRQASTA